MNNDDFFKETTITRSAPMTLATLGFAIGCFGLVATVLGAGAAVWFLLSVMP